MREVTEILKKQLERLSNASEDMLSFLFSGVALQMIIFLLPILRQGISISLRIAPIAP